MPLCISPRGAGRYRRRDLQAERSGHVVAAARFSRRSLAGALVTIFGFTPRVLIATRVHNTMQPYRRQFMCPAKNTATAFMFNLADWWLLRSLCLIGATCNAHKDPLNPDLVSGTDVFVSGTENYPTFRIPAALRLANGDLLVFAEGRHGGDHGWNDIVMKRSSDGSTHKP